MPATIDYYFYSASPFTYLGHAALVDVARQHGATVAFRPVNLMELWKVSGAVPPGQRPPVRQRYRFIELQRIAGHRGLPINIQPKHWPVDPALADLCVAAIVHRGDDPAGFMGRVFSGVWAKEENIADETTVRRYLDETGHDADAIIAASYTDEIAAIRDENSRLAIEADAIGVPAYVLNGEVFWGQDRIEYLDEALRSGREPFHPPA